MSQVHREQLKVISEKAVLVNVRLPGEYVDPVDPFGELRSLTETAGAVVVGEMLQKRQKPNRRTYLGKGKTEELAQLVKMTAATLVIFDHDLLPAQIKELERITECKIIDRSELILDIFANRAQTHAAKLQVEIAQLEYTYPRLRAMWDHLGQIVGGAPVGIGTRGPGEQQLEIDRRIVQRRLAQLRRELEGIQGRKQREVAQRNEDHFTVGLVGYTNAGKSTLFNRITAGGAFAHGKLFATLATRIERWDLGHGNEAMLSDTVGFIRDLPHHLVASFRSTLEETIHAAALVLLVDVSDPNAFMQLETVEQTLDELGTDATSQIVVLNKIDRLEDSKNLLVWLNHRPDAIPVSAETGEGLKDLDDRVLQIMLGGVREVTISASLSDGRSIALLERRAEILKRDFHDGEAIMRARLGRRQVDQLLAQGVRMTIDGLSPKEALLQVWGGT
jgi:GTP-binding protein HflX